MLEKAKVVDADGNEVDLNALNVEVEARATATRVTTTRVTTTRVTTDERPATDARARPD